MFMALLVLSPLLAPVPAVANPGERGLVLSGSSPRSAVSRGKWQIRAGQAADPGDPLDGQLEPHAELNPSDHGPWNHAVDQVDGPEERQGHHQGTHDQSGCDNFICQQTLGDGDGGDGLHGLDRDRLPEHHAGHDVHQPGTDQDGAHVQLTGQGHGNHQRQKRTQIPQRPGELQPRELEATGPFRQPLHHFETRLHL